jgi:amidase
VRSKEVQSAELVEAAIERIERLNPALNAVITPMFALARTVATGPQPDGPFAGVPFLLKDLLAEHEGVPLCEGSAFLRDHVSTCDSEIVRRWKAAGLVILGKTNTPELGMVPATEPRLFGRTCNPWDLGLSPGGSSGGSAAAVAAGLVAAAHGNDAGGSIRIPASSCGIFGMKPTRARNPLGPHYGEIYGGLCVEHVLTRSVRDSAGILDATAGPDAGDPYSAPPPAGPFLEEMRKQPGRLHIGFSTTAPSGIDVHAECVAAVRDAAALCGDLGHVVEEASPEIDAGRLAQALGVMFAAGTAWSIDDWARRTNQEITPGQFEPGTWALAERGWRTTSAGYLIAVQDVQRISRDIARFFTRFDAWLTPTMATPPLSPGSFHPSAEEPRRARENLARYMDFAQIANATGQPAMSVPLYQTAGGIPIGTQFVGRFGDEAMLFRLAAQLETARPWTDRWPPMAQ